MSWNIIPELLDEPRAEYEGLDPDGAHELIEWALMQEATTKEDSND